jgi:hypothetical protein
MARKRNEARSIISAEGGAAAPATHHRSVRSSVTPPVVSAPVVAPSEPEPVIAGTPVVAISEREEIANLAYSYWEARGSQGGSPEEDWSRAEREVRRRRQLSAR